MRQPFIITLALLSLIIGPAVADSQPPSTQSVRHAEPHAAGGVELTASLLTDRFEAEERITLNVTMTNVSAHPVAYSESFPEIDFKLLVLDASGRQVDQTRWGRQTTHDPSRYRQVSKTLEPGKTATYAVRLSRLIDLSTVGKYTASVSCMIPTVRWGEFATPASRPVSFEIGDRRPANTDGARKE